MDAGQFSISGGGQAMDVGQRLISGGVFLGSPKMQDRRGLDAGYGLIPCGGGHGRGGGHGHGGIHSPLTQDRVSYKHLNIY